MKKIIQLKYFESFVDIFVCHGKIGSLIKSYTQ